MKIIEGGIQHWCQHENLTFESNAPVVGLFAENGAGKSNFLAAMRYLVTGELDLSKERYIQNYDPDLVLEDGKKPKWFTSGWCRFIQGGMEGKISRRITPTTASRELEWEGKTYTKAAEVDSMMEEILGADKKAVSSAIFIGQGDLEKLLFGPLSERERLFIKFLNLGHFDKVASAAESRAKLLYNQVEDLTAQKDEIMLSIAAAARAEDEERKKLDALPDHAQTLTALRCLSSDLSALSRERASLAQDKQKLGTEQQALTTYLAQAGVSSRAEVADKLSEAERLGKELAASLEEMREAQKAHERLTAHRNAFDSWQSTQKELESANASRPETAEEVLRKEEEKLQRMVNLDTEKTQKSGEVEKHRSRLAEMKSAEIVDPSGLEKQIEDLVSGTHTKQEHLKVLEAAASGNSEEGACPVCGSEISEHLLSKENLDKIRAEIGEATGKIDELRAELQALRENNAGINNTIATLEENIRQGEERLREIDEELQDRDRATMLARLDSLHEQLDLHYEADTKVGNLPGIVEARKATYENLKAELQPDDEEKSQIYNATTLPVFEKQIEQARENYQNLRSVYDRIGSLEEKVSDIREEIDQADAKIAEMVKRADAQVEKFDESIRTRLEESVDVVQDIINELDTAQSTRSTQAGVVAARQASVREAKERLAELEDRESKDAARRGIAESMKRFKDAFSRTGLPKTFIRYRFDQLSALTQENLAAMEANFSVFPSDENELSFDFVRVDNGSDYVMHQDQLSGGQRVSLSIAFLLAVQQLVVPDIGFLVLDEPSLHLDERARNDLKDLLIGLSEQLRNSEAQVFVVDHSPDLRPAFQRLIEIKK